MSNQRQTPPCILSAWNLHEDELFHWLLRQLSHHDQAADTLHDIFLKALSQDVAFCSIENPRAWLFRVARNTVIDSARMSKPFESLPDELAAQTSDDRAPVDELDTCISRNLPALAPEDRHIIEACDLHGQTVSAYAEANDLKLSTAKTRLLRARKHLRDTLVKHCQVHFNDAGQVCCHTPRRNY